VGIRTQAADTSAARAIASRPSLSLVCGMPVERPRMKTLRTHSQQAKPAGCKPGRVGSAPPWVGVVMAFMALVMVVLSGAVHSVADVDAPAPSVASAAVTTSQVEAGKNSVGKYVAKGSVEGKVAFGHPCTGHCATHHVAVAPSLASDLPVSLASSSWIIMPASFTAGADLQSLRRPPRA
jgi:hypothetical protein